MNYESCKLCPRGCSVNRHIAKGFCGCSDTIRAAKASLHMWEEPCISGLNGSGTLFFTGCTLRCCFCQNYKISQEGFGKELTPGQLSDIFLRLQDQGAHNINLVTATQYLPSILTTLDLVKHKLIIPVVYNCGGYETIETINALDGYVDIWLPDLKYFSPELSGTYSSAPDYFEIASEAVRQMISQTGELVFAPFTDSKTGASCNLMKKGTILRHMVLPGAKDDSIRLLHWIHENLPQKQFLISIMSQYTPYYNSSNYPEINRRITTYEYQKVIDEAIALNLIDGFMQEKSSAKEEYTPPFDLDGLS